MSDAEKSYVKSGWFDKNIISTNDEVEFTLGVPVNEGVFSTSTSSSIECSDSESDEPVPKHTARRFHSAKDFFFEKLRLETFHHFCHDIDERKLAKKGFVAINKGYMLQCVYCRGVLILWSKGDSVIREHNSSCPNAVSLMANVPKDQQQLGKCLEERLKKKAPSRINLHFRDGKNLDRFPLHSNEAERRRSFNHRYLFSNMPEIDDIVKAGFYSNGFADCTLCFACGGGVFNWSPKDKPKEVHARLYPDCRLTKLYREAQIETNDEDEEVDSVHTEIDSEVGDKTAFEVKSEWFTDLELAKAMVGQWELEFICDAFKYKFNKYGTLPATKNEALDAIFDYEEILEDGRKF